MPPFSWAATTVWFEINRANLGSSARRACRDCPALLVCVGTLAVFDVAAAEAGGDSEPEPVNTVPAAAEAIVTVRTL
jgi:hypothetical protein